MGSSLNLWLVAGIDLYSSSVMTAAGDLERSSKSSACSSSPRFYAASLELSPAREEAAPPTGCCSSVLT